MKSSTKKLKLAKLSIRNLQQDDLKNFARKVKAGANAAITQYFYNADAYFFFLEACHKKGISINIVPGIMPITNFSKLARFSEMCGAEIPRWIRRRLEALGDDSQAVKAFGQEVVHKLCERLVAGGAIGLHFYTLNHAEPSLKLLEQCSFYDNSVKSVHSINWQ